MSISQNFQIFKSQILIAVQILVSLINLVTKRKYWPKYFAAQAVERSIRKKENKFYQKIKEYIYKGYTK